MRIGVVLPIGQEDGMPAAPDYREIRGVAVEAEASGLDSVWVYDHLLFRFDGETTGIHECWTMLAAIAEATERVQLGTIVMCTGFRNPALLAKMAATLDHISGGRLILGLGCGWHEPEYRAFGYPFDHRVGRFEEALGVVVPLIRGERVTMDGQWTYADDAVVLPPPRRRSLPVLVASEGSRMLRLTAHRLHEPLLRGVRRPLDDLGAGEPFGGPLGQGQRDERAAHAEDGREDQQRLEVEVHAPGVQDALHA